MSAQGARQLISWKEIADYLARDVRTVVRWEKDKNLPVHRVPGGKRQSVFAYTNELDAWLRGESAAVATATEGPQRDVPATLLPPFRTTPQRRIRRAEWAMLIAVALICFSLLGFLFRPQPRSEPPLRLTRITTGPGFVYGASLSPDGRQIAYSFRHRNESAWHIYVQLIGAGEPVRLTKGDQKEGYPSWSPDGRYLAYATAIGDEESLAVVPALGGTPRMMTRIRDPHVMSYVNWTPDGRGLVFPDRESENEPVTTWILHLDTGDRTRFFSAPDILTREFAGAFSPDGRLFAFARGSTAHIGSLYVMPAEGGEPRRIAQNMAAANGMTWTADSRELIFPAVDLEHQAQGFTRVAVSGSEPKAAFTSPMAVVQPSISRNGAGLLYLQVQEDANIWRFDVGKDKTARSLVIDSQERDVDPACSPDGKQVAFLSYLGGGADLWIAGDAGDKPKRASFLADSPIKNSGTPDYSPDGRRIAFASFRNGQTDISVLDVASGNIQHLTSHPTNDSFPRWSRDGSAIYFTSDRTGRFEIWKMAADGGSQLQVTQHGGYVAAESFDGKYLYYGKPDADGLWRMPLAGGAEEPVLNAPVRRFAWTMAPGGIFFIAGANYPDIAVHYYDLNSRRTLHALAFDPDHMPQTNPGRLSACRDGRTLFVSQSDLVRTDLVLAENFR